MKLKLTVILLSALVLSTAAALPPRGMSGPLPGAGPGPGGERMPGPPPDLGAMLDLQGDTLAKVDALSEQQHLALFRLHREQMRAERQLQAQFRAELAKILSPEQLNRFEQMRSPQRHQGGRGNLGPGQQQCRDSDPQPKAPSQP